MFDERAAAFGEAFVILFTGAGAHGFAIVCCVAGLGLGVKLLELGLKLRLLIGGECVPCFDEVGFGGGFAGVDFAQAIPRPLHCGSHFDVGCVGVAGLLLRAPALIG